MVLWFIKIILKKKCFKNSLKRICGTKTVLQWHCCKNPHLETFILRVYKETFMQMKVRMEFKSS